MVTGGVLPTEIVYLGWSTILLLLYIVLQAVPSVAELGLPYSAGGRDEGRRPAGLTAGRGERALRNLLETYPAFIALALALAVTGKVGGSGAVGAAIWFWARLIYLPLYLSAVPYVRTAAFAVSLVGLGMMLIRLLA